MILMFFSSRGWESWGLEHRPLVAERMPVLIDDDLRLEDGPGRLRPVSVVNQWLRQLPVSGAPAPASWASYARVVREWLEFLAARGVGLFDSRDRLRRALGAYSEFRGSGAAGQRFAASTWNRHVSVLSVFYRWAITEGHAEAEPFTYKTARALFDGTSREVTVNLASRRCPKPHVRIRYLEPDFAALFLQGLAGLAPDGGPDTRFAGRELSRNHAVGGLALATGLRLQEFSHLLVWEIPALPTAAGALPVPFPVPSGVTKGRKFRTTWVSHEALASVHQYADLDRAAAAAGSAWRPAPRRGEALLVSDPGPLGGRINGIRRRWDTLTPGERCRLVAPGGGSCLLALRGDGGPFTAWASVFERTSDRIRVRFEPRFPAVSPHRLRHTMAMRTLEFLVSGYYRQAAGLVTATGTAAGPDAALVLYLAKADPLMVLRDLLGHSSVTTTEAYLRRLDTTRIYADAYERAGLDAGLIPARAWREAAAEFGPGDAGGGER